jgi:hypothetical protein
MKRKRKEGDHSLLKQYAKSQEEESQGEITHELLYILILRGHVRE